MQDLRDVHGWDHLGDDFDGRLEYEAMMPNYGPASLAWERGQAARPSEGSGHLSTTDCLPPATELADVHDDEAAGGELAKQKNRQAQKRFRERQRGKAKELGIQFAQTSTELQELKVKQKALEERNAVLEKLIRLNEQQQPGPGQGDNQMSPDMIDVYDITHLNAANMVETLGQPVLRLTLWEGAEKVIPVRDIGKIPLPTFAQLYTAYVCQLGTCLLELQDHEMDGTCPIVQKLRRWCRECDALIVGTSFSNPSNLKQLYTAKMDEGKVDPDHNPSEEWMRRLLVTLDYTDAQTADVLYSRRLYYRKLGQLTRDHKAILQQMDNDYTPTKHVSDKFSNMTNWSEQLRSIAREEYCVYLQLCACYYRGIHTSKQFAASLVCAYPRFPYYKAIEYLAADRGEPSLQSLLNDTSVDSQQHAQNWQQVIDYLATITMDNYHLHCPLLKQSA